MSEDRMSWWQGLIGLRGAAGETTTRESSQVGVETKIKIQVFAFLVLAFVAIPGILAGAWLALTSLLALVDVDLTGQDAFFGLVLLALVALGVRALVPTFKSASERVQVLTWGLLVVLAVVFVVVMYSRLSRGLDFWATLGLCFGLGLLYGGPLLAYNMTVLLRDPYAWQSPFERRYLDLYERERFPKKEEQETVVHEIRTDKGEFVTSTESLGLSWGQLVTFAKRLVGSGYDLREETWASAGQRDLFSTHGAYRRVRNTLERQGLLYRLVPDDPKSTFGVTRGGRAAFERLAEERST